jgi:hypothetical protein
VSRARFIGLSVLFDAIAYNIAVLVAFVVRFGLRVPSVNLAPFVTLAP